MSLLKSVPQIAVDKENAEFAEKLVPLFDHRYQPLPCASVWSSAHALDSVMAALSDHLSSELAWSAATIAELHPAFQPLAKDNKNLCICHGRLVVCQSLQSDTSLPVACCCTLFLATPCLQHLPPQSHRRPFRNLQDSLPLLPSPPAPTNSSSSPFFRPASTACPCWCLVCIVRVPTEGLWQRSKLKTTKWGAKELVGA